MMSPVRKVTEAWLKQSQKKRNAEEEQGDHQGSRGKQRAGLVEASPLGRAFGKL
jgi:hypothetical protein